MSQEMPAIRVTCKIKRHLVPNCVHVCIDSHITLVGLCIFQLYITFTFRWLPYSRKFWRGKSSRSEQGHKNFTYESVTVYNVHDRVWYRVATLKNFALEIGAIYE